MQSVEGSSATDNQLNGVPTPNLVYFVHFGKLSNSNSTESVLTQLVGLESLVGSKKL